jgi:carbonic anhydrase
MSNLTYPEATEYVAPKKNILVLSCMDLRLTDNVVNFLHFDNLTNRFDHCILAGTSLLCSKNYQSHLNKAGLKYIHFIGALESHIELAKLLHKIEDVYIFEHQDCGAYTNLTDTKKVKPSDLLDLKLEKEWHKKISTDLAHQIKNSNQDLHVHCFYIDLRGNVELLYTLP